MFHSQPVAWVLGETLDAARAGAARVRAAYEPLPAILTIEQAIDAGSFLTEPLRLARGDMAALAASPLRVEGELAIGGQEHFYLETQSAIAWLDESGGMAVQSSTQHPSETQEIVARVLGVPKHAVTAECLRMGGAFGGKEVQANSWAAVAALGVWKTRRPVRVRLTRALDMALTGKRHPFLARYTAGVSGDGRLQALTLALFSDGGWSLDLSEAIMWRALFHCDNAYRLPAVDAMGRVCRTHKTSQTAFRGFGGPQGMLVIEEILARAAAALSLPAHVVRERNFYRDGDTTHYGQRVEQAGRIGEIWTRLKDTSRFDDRREAVAEFNARSTHVKRGLAITPVKFGISFTAAFFNQAGALVLIYRDGSVQVNHGGTEMGQGLFTKIQQIAADSLGVTLDQRAADADAHRQGAEHVGHGGVRRHRSERRRRRGRLCPAARAAAARRGRPARVRGVRRAVRGQRGVGRRPPRAVCGRVRGRLHAAHAALRPGLLPHARHPLRSRRRARASRSTTSPTAPRCRKWRSTASPATTGCSEPISCRTWAIRLHRWSTAARSKAASSRAWAG